MEKIEILNDVIQKVNGVVLNESIFNDNLDLIRDLGFDSIKFVMLLINLEEMFNISIDDDDLDLEKLSNYMNLKKIIGA